MLRSPQMCQNWLLMDENEIKVSFCFKDESCGLCPKLGGTADNTFVPVMDMAGIFFCVLVKGGCHEAIF